MMKQTFQLWIAYKIPTNCPTLWKGTHFSSYTYNYSVGQLMKLNTVQKSQHYNEVVHFLQLLYIVCTNLLLLNFSTCLNPFSLKKKKISNFFFFTQDPKRNKHCIWITLVTLLSSASHWGENVGPDQQISLPSKNKKRQQHQHNLLVSLFFFPC